MDADYNETHEDWASFGLAQEMIIKEYRSVIKMDKVGTRYIHLVHLDAILMRMRRRRKSENDDYF